MQGSSTQGIYALFTGGLYVVVGIAVFKASMLN